MIKAILFDAGGVIIKSGNQINIFAKIFRAKNKHKLWEKINHYVGPLCAGKMSEKEYWKIIAKSEGIDPKNIPDNLWAKNYGKTTKIDHKMMALIKSLRKQYKTILISNTIRPHVIINKKRGLFDNFDDVINSNEVHLSKDTKSIFQLALKRNHLKAEECIFIDDIQKFVDIAKSAGIPGICFRNVSQLKKELSRLGML
ncbi:MAG: HAD family phosphatase [Nanoarchaeota archaeon]|nr:HAD family phosphatase [Nanoarchaeota archaeon]